MKRSIITRLPNLKSRVLLTYFSLKEIQQLRPFCYQMSSKETATYLNLVLIKTSFFL